MAVSLRVALVGLMEADRDLEAASMLREEALGAAETLREEALEAQEQLAEASARHEAEVTEIRSGAIAREADLEGERL